MSVRRTPTLSSLFNLSMKKFAKVVFKRPQVMTQLIYSPYDAVLYKALDVIFDTAIIAGANTIHIWYRVQEDGRFEFCFTHNGTNFDLHLLDELHAELAEYWTELKVEQTSEDVRVYLTLPFYPS